MDQHLIAKFEDGDKPVTNSGISQSQRPVSIALGLTAKKYLNKMVALSAAVKQAELSRAANVLPAETPKSELTRPDSQVSNHNSTKSIIKFPPISKESSNTKTVSFIDSPKDCSQENRLPHSNSQKFSQTMETAFAPCELCTRCQLALRDVSQTIIEQCKSEALPTNLERFVNFFIERIGSASSNADSSFPLGHERRSSIPISTGSSIIPPGTIVGSQLLSPNDVERWKMEMQKDLKRLRKHFQDVRLSNTELSERLDKAEKMTEALRHQLASAESRKKVEMEDLIQERSRLRQKSEEMSADVQIERERNQEMRTAMNQLQLQMESQMAHLQEEMEQQVHLLHTLDEIGKYFTECTNKADIHKEVGKMKVRLEDVEVHNQRLSQEMEQLTVQIHNSQLHAKNVEEKHQKLISRLDEVLKENDSLQDEIVELQEAHEQEKELVMQLKKETTQLQYKLKENDVFIKSLVDAKEQLTQSLSAKEEVLQSLKKDIQKLEEEKLLLVAYPDLNGPVNQDISDSGDLFTDMANQVEANTCRINLLTQQNSKLQTSLQKLTLMTAQPTQLPLNAWRIESDSGNMYAVKDDDQKGSGPSGVQPVRLWDVHSQPLDTTTTRSSYHQNCTNSDGYIFVANERGTLPPVNKIPSTLSQANERHAASAPSIDDNCDERRSRGYDTNRSNRGPPTRSKTPSTSRGSAPNDSTSSTVLQWTTSSKPPRRPLVFACPQCGKMHKRKEDLDAHKLQCGVKKHI